MSEGPTSLRHRLGVLAWLVRPLYLVVEVAVWLRADQVMAFSLRDDTISDLGATRCTAPDALLLDPEDGIPVCSPWHDLMNANFVVTGLLLAVGAVLLADRLGRGPLARAVVVLLVVSGLSSLAVGLVPLDRDEDLHFLVAFPVFVAQPVALVLLGVLLWRRRVLAAALVVTGVAAAAGAIGFVLVGDTGAGLLERIAIWPPLVAVAWVAWHLRRPEAPRSDAPRPA